MKSEVEPTNMSDKEAILTQEKDKLWLQNKTDLPMAEEIGGRKGPEPTRFGDWEKNGRCIDF